MQDLYDRLEKWIKASGINITLSPGTTSEILEASAQQIRRSYSSFEWPPDMYCWFMMTNGQNPYQPGLFGGYSFYEYRTDMRPLAIEEITEALPVIVPSLPGLIPFAVYSSRKMHFLVVDPTCHDGLSNYSRYQLVTSGGQRNTAEFCFFSFSRILLGSTKTPRYQFRKRHLRYPVWKNKFIP